VFSMFYRCLLSGNDSDGRCQQPSLAGGQSKVRIAVVMETEPHHEARPVVAADNCKYSNNLKITILRLF